jgi:hypothetical protein
MQLAPKYYVYEWVRPDYNLVFNVGKGKNRRAWSMYNRNKHCRDLVNYLNKNGLNYEVRIIARFISEQSAYDFEEERIAYFGLENLTNDLPGGRNGGGGMTGKKHKPESIERIRASQKGKIISIEQRKKLKEINTGKKHSAETCAKMSESRKGKVISFETSQKISKSIKASKNTPEGKEKSRIAAAKTAAMPKIHEKRKATREANNKKNPNYWENRLTSEEIFFIGTSLLSKKEIKLRFSISEKVIDKIRKLIEAQLGIPPRKNFGFIGKISNEMIDKCRLAKKSFWDNISQEERIEMGRKMSAGRRRSKESKSKGI